MSEELARQEEARFRKAADALTTLLSSREATFTLAHGDLTVKWPANLTPAEAQDIEEYFALLMRVIKRTAAENARSPQAPSEQASSRGEQ